MNETALWFVRLRCTDRGRSWVESRGIFATDYQTAASQALQAGGFYSSATRSIESITRAPDLLGADVPEAENTGVGVPT